MPPRSRRNRPAPQRELNEAAQVTDQLQAASYTKRDIARITNRDPLVAQFYKTQRRSRLRARSPTGSGRCPDLRYHRPARTRHDRCFLHHPPHHVQRHQSQRPQQGRLDHPHRIGTGRVGAQAIDSASSCLRPLIAEAARQGLRLAFTVRFAKTGYLHPSGSRTDSLVIRRDVTQRADHTGERSYGSAQAVGHDAADFARRVDVVGGDVSAAVQQRLVETRRIDPDARILDLEVRTWRPR
ncbi:helix-turn-helix domain containing protein [Streptomyces sp. BF23-18]|uniref:helix-turn-helix domain containing protein n=1 Tax=Streptomyces sp. BF23-18 TaxID=3240282 RepID=UPI0034E50BE5